MNRDRMRKIALAGMLFVAVLVAVWFSVNRRRIVKPEAPAAPTTADKVVAEGMAGMKMDEPQATPAATPPGAAAQQGGIFIAPEKQQLIGMRSVAAEMGTRSD